jgi:hypothetical protein
MTDSLGSEADSLYSPDRVDDLDFFNEPDTDKVLDILEGDDPSLTLVIKEYWNDIQAEVTEYPLMKLYVAGLYKMANEYTRIENQIVELGLSVETLGNNPALTNERARIRDNMTSLTTEGWKLLNAVLDSLHKIQSMINKMKDRSGDDLDPFESFMSG